MATKSITIELGVERETVYREAELHYECDEGDAYRLNPARASVRVTAIRDDATGMDLRPLVPAAQLRRMEADLLREIAAEGALA